MKYMFDFTKYLQEKLYINAAFQSIDASY